MSVPTAPSDTRRDPGAGVGGGGWWITHPLQRVGSLWGNIRMVGLKPTDAPLSTFLLELNGVQVVVYELF